MSDDVNKNYHKKIITKKSFALVATGKKSLAFIITLSSITSENFKQIPFGK